MSFCIVNIISNLSMDPSGISFLSAGDDQTVICAPYVHLTAIAETEDITTHETFWEQISGSAVILLGNPYNTLLISYAQTSNMDDKIFRFWVDKGTDKQLSSDTIVYGSPTEKFYMKTLGDDSVSLITYPPNQITTNMLFVTPAPFSYDVGPAGDSVIDSSDLMLYWTLPTSPVGVLKQSMLMSSTGGAGFQQLVIVPSGQPTFYANANNTDLFRVDLTYTVSQVPQIEEVDNGIHSYIGQPTRLYFGHNVQAVDRITAVSGGAIDTQVSYNIRVKVEVTYSDAMSSISGDLDVSSISVIYTTRTLFSNTYLENISVPSLGDTSVSGIIIIVVLKTRLSVGG